MPHTIKDKKQLLSRVRRLQGQTSALEKALDNDEECVAILQQIAAIRGAANGLMAQVLEGHVREHLGAENVAAAQRRADVEEVVAILRSYLR